MPEINLIFTDYFVLREETPIKTIKINLPYAN